MRRKGDCRLRIRDADVMARPGNAVKGTWNKDAINNMGGQEVNRRGLYQMRDDKLV